MAREIKIRAWLPRHKCFVEYELGTEYDENDFKDAVYQQYTGIKDKNGKEIYEGDLILGSSGRYIRLVHFNNENYGEVWGWNNLEWGTIEDGKIVECKKDYEFGNMDLTYYEPQIFYYGNSPCKTDVVIGNIIEGISNEFSKIIH